MKLDRFCTLDELPIPQDAPITQKWTGQMQEMAAHIGPFLTLLVVDRLGGQEVQVPSDPERNRLTEVIGPDGAAIISRIYGGNVLRVPVGRAALDEARRAGIIAAIRAKTMTIAEAAPILRTSRSYLSHLVNATPEGEEAEAINVGRLRRLRHDPRQLNLFNSTPEE
jgi:hypothetical protein